MALTRHLPVVHHPGYSVPLPPNHPFPMAKFSVLRALLEGGPYQFHRPAAATREQLLLAHDADYLDALFNGTLDRSAQRRIGFECSADLVGRCALETGGTLLTVELALQHGLACNSAGGTHHAHRDFGSGYCLLNDMAIAALWACAERDVRRVLIIDLDVHQGDGTAAILATHPEIFTFSMHCARNFPHRKQTSDLDVALADAVGDDGYLQALENHLPWLLDRFAPDLVIYDAGVDVHADDRLGYLSLSDAGLARRDFAVIDACRSRGIATACVIGGGYDRDLAALATRHAVLHRQATEVWACETI